MLLRPELADDKAGSWARSYNSKVHAWRNKCSAEHGIAIVQAGSELQHGDKVYLLSEKSFSSTLCTAGTLLRERTVDSETEYEMRFRIDIPFDMAFARFGFEQFNSAIDMIWKYIQRLVLLPPQQSKTHIL